MFAFRIAAAAALSLASSPSAQAQPAQLRIDLTNFSYAPQPIHLAAGRPVTLTLVNRSSGGHDFTARKFFASSKIIAGAAPRGRIEVPERAVRTITLVPRAGRYNVHCSHFLHKQFGMQTVIVVS